MTAACASCHAALEPGALEGLCPRCLLVRALPLQRAEDVPTTGPTTFVPPTPAELAPLFPQLEVLQVLGQGGMGAVYKARQVKLDRLVALKVLPPAAARDPGFAERFGREARALAKLNHPHVVAVHDFGDVNGLYYLVMEFVEGVNLRQALAAGKLEPKQALALVAQLCSALQYAHHMGVVHRDIKPENVMLDRQGHVKVADFGLAKLVGQTQLPDRLTGTRQAMGTPHYMAPEQWERPLEVDHRADIYSLGVVFYELLTGELPLGKFAPPSAKAGADPRLDEVVLRAIEKEPAQRYQRMSEMKSAVESVEAPPALPASPPAPINPGFEFAVTMLMAFGLAVPAVVLTYLSIHGDPKKVLTFLIVALVAAAYALYEGGRYYRRLGSLVILGTVLSWLLCDLSGRPHLIPLSGGWFWYAASLFFLAVAGERLVGSFRPEGEGPATSPTPAPDPRPVHVEPHLQGLYNLLVESYNHGRFHGQLSVAPTIEGEVLTSMREACDVPPGERVLAVLDLGSGEGESGLVIGSQGLYWYDGDDTPYPGQAALPYDHLAGRTFVNHGTAVYVGDEGYICPNEEETWVSGEELATFLGEIRDALAPRENPPT